MLSPALRPTETVWIFILRVSSLRIKGFQFVSYIFPSEWEKLRHPCETTRTRTDAGNKKGRILRSGESQLLDGRYRYRYTDQLGRRQTVYSWKLLPTDRIPKDKKCLKSLREMETEISQELLSGINANLAKIKRGALETDLWSA